MKKNTSYFKERAKEFIVENKKSFASLPRNALVEDTNASNSGLEEVGLYSTGEPFMSKNI